MRVNGTETGIENLYSSPLTTPSAGPAATSGQQSSITSSFPVAPDSTAISNTASLILRTLAIPEQLSSRVPEVRAAVASGSFQIDSSRVASALMANMLAEGRS